MTTTAPPQAVMKAALQAYVDRTNAGDAAGLVALFAPDAVIEDPVGSPVKTYAEFARWFGDSVAFGAQITPVAPHALVQHLNWQPQLLDFSSAPLGAAVAEFNRRNRVQFVLADSELAATPIVASIRSDNIEGFARFLAATPGLQIDRRSDVRR